ncbi:MAG: glycosyltransferase family 4 protein [Flavobacteriales bacterium]|nr:glycosyltransferase family 4 protein [Flavobacteriales bacterium]
MKIAVDTRLLLKDKMDGLGQFTQGAFKHIVTNNPSIDFIFIFDREPHPDFIFKKNVTAEVIGPQARHPFLYKIWYQFSLKKCLKKIKPDIFIGTNGMIPFNIDARTLSVIHDLNFEHHPQHLPKLIRNYYCKNFPKFAKKSTRIATVSEFSKNDIKKTYKIDSSKIDVVYNGPNENFKPIPKNEITTIQNKYSDSSPFFLFIGTLHPRKNLVNLFKAFDQFKSQSNSDFKLVIVGRKMWWTKEIESTFNQLKFKSDVIFTGRVSDNDLYKITAAAHALTYVPIFEGFGIPLVEAMSCGVPVITSNITSMPEVVENAGILIDPFSIDEISNAMLKISSDNNLRTELSEKSKIQAKKFSWQKTGDLLWESILKTINE